MTEQEWLNCTDPAPMLAFLKESTSERKLRLFACACCRLIWQVLTDRVGREAVAVAERFADAEATQEELLDAGDATAERLGEITPPGRDDDDYSAYNAVSAAFSSLGEDEGALIRAAEDASLAAGDRAAEQAEQCRIIRDIFSNPFLPVSAELPWLTSTVVALAEGIYTDRAFDRMPILADALQDAGCDNADILNHCRSDGPHVRGCWVVDLLLGKR